MAKDAAILGVHLLDHVLGPIRVGTLIRDADGAVTFNISETYLRDPARPVLSLGWYNPEDEEATHDRLARRTDKIALNGSLPPWFSGLLPEGALHELVLAEMGPGDHDDFDVLARLGADLPGAVLVTPETDLPPSVGSVDRQGIAGFRAVEPNGTVKFSLAGVQLKFTANAAGNRLTAPGRGESGRCIIKVPSERYRDLPETEYGAMKLAEAIGVQTASCRLVPCSRVEGIPAEMLAHGQNVLVVDRFDRAAEGARIHIEDAGQIVGAWGERKYTMATTETIMNMVRRFSTDGHADILEAMRRVVADVLLGNGDNHLKNWSFIFPEPGQIRLSPAYDIVPTVLFAPNDQLALRFVRTHDFNLVNLHRFERVASFLRLDTRLIRREVIATVRRALEIWPGAAPALLGQPRAARILDRLERLTLVQEAQ